jgi:hypothetical protein
MVRDSCIRRIHPHAALTIYHLSITNTSRKYDKTTNSVNTECLHTPPFRACQDKTPDQEKHHLSPPPPLPPLSTFPPATPPLHEPHHSPPKIAAPPHLLHRDQNATPNHPRCFIIASINTTTKPLHHIQHQRTDGSKRNAGRRQQGADHHGGGTVTPKP